jgi:DNA repair exonuclease SbcCD nuclease subunit
VLEQIRDLCVEHGVPLVIAGDTLDSSTIKHDERFLLDWFFGELERYEIPTVVITGNHEHLRGEQTLLDGYTHIPFKHITIVTWKPRTCVFGDIGFICIPWRDYKTSDIKEIVETQLPHVAGCKHKVVVMHECITGSTMDSGHVITKGPRLPINKDITYWAIGDIHARQKANLSNSHYAGAPAQFRFDDSLPKGILLVDLNKPSEPHFVPLIFKPLRVVQSVKDITDDAHYKVVGGLDEVMEANRHEQVVKTDLVRPAKQIKYEKFAKITDGLPEFLASKGIDSSRQEFAVNWVKEALAIKTEE